MSIIAQAIDEYFETQIKVYPCRVNRASSIGDHCERKLVLARTSWDKAEPHGVGLQRIFHEGNVQEKIAISTMQDAGFDILEQQKSFEIKENGEVLLSGHIDGKMADPKNRFKGVMPFEFKSMSPMIFEGIKTWDDILKSQKFWIQKYPGQLMSYLYGENREEGIFIIKNKSTGEIRDFTVKLDYDLMQGLLDKAKRINKHVADGTIPEPNVSDACSRCEHRFTCLPEKQFDGVAMLESDELLELLMKRDQLAEAAKEYNQIDKRVKGMVKNVEGMIGDFAIEGQEIDRAAYSVDAGSYWKSKITKIT